MVLCRQNALFSKNMLIYSNPVEFDQFNRFDFDTVTKPLQATCRSLIL